MKLYSALVLSLWLPVGCSTAAPAPAAASDSALSEVRVSESPTELAIVGLNAQGVAVANASVRLGIVTFPDDGHTGDGRQLVIDVGERHIENVSLRTAAQLPPTHYAEINGFLDDPRVAGPLSRWGIEVLDGSHFAVAAAAAERPYTICTPAPTNCGSTWSCVQDGPASDNNEQYVCCGNASALLDRICNTTSMCPPVGPAGCGVCWTEAYAGRTCNTGEPFDYWWTNNNNSCTDNGSSCTGDGYGDGSDANCCSGQCCNYQCSAYAC